MGERDIMMRSLVESNERLRWKISYLRNVLRKRQYDRHFGQCIGCGADRGKPHKAICDVEKVLNL